MVVIMPHPSPLVTLIGVRGTFEPFEDATWGMGPTVAAIAAEVSLTLPAQAPASSVEPIGLPYPASSLRYRHRSGVGVGRLVRTLGAPANGSSLFVLIGLSQGADVVRHALGSGLVPEDAVARIVADGPRDDRRARLA